MGAAGIVRPAHHRGDRVAKRVVLGGARTPKVLFCGKLVPHAGDLRRYSCRLVGVRYRGRDLGRRSVGGTAADGDLVWLDQTPTVLGGSRVPVLVIRRSRGADWARNIALLALERGNSPFFDPRSQ